MGGGGVTAQSTSLQEMKQGQCICPLSWSVHSNFTGEGKCNERGWACTPHPHQPGLILPSSLNVRQKAAVATLCTLWGGGGMGFWASDRYTFAAKSLYRSIFLDDDILHCLLSMSLIFLRLIFLSWRYGMEHITALLSYTNDGALENSVTRRDRTASPTPPCLFQSLICSDGSSNIGFSDN